MQETFEKYGYSPLETSILCYYDLLALKYSVGIEGQLIESELIAIFVEGYKKLGIDIVIKYNNRKLMNGIIEACNINKEKISDVITIIDKFEKLSKEELEQEFNKIDVKENQVQSLYKYLEMDINELSNIFENTINKNIK